MSVAERAPIREDGFPEWIVWNGEQIETPDLEQIQFWVYDSVCETVTGDMIEPDGYGPDGAPSWLIALGLM